MDWEAARGNFAAAEAAATRYVGVSRTELQEAGSGSRNHQIAARVHWHRREYSKCLEEAKEAARMVVAYLATPGLTRNQKTNAELVLMDAVFDLGRGNLFLANWAEAEAQLRRAIKLEVSAPFADQRATPAAIHAAA